jgi:hypothetical protein
VSLTRPWCFVNQTCARCNGNRYDPAGESEYCADCKGVGYTLEAAGDNLYHVLISAPDLPGFCSILSAESGHLTEMEPGWRAHDPRMADMLSVEAAVLETVATALRDWVCEHRGGPRGPSGPDRPTRPHAPAGTRPRFWQEICDDVRRWFRRRGKQKGRAA